MKTTKVVFLKKVNWLVAILDKENEKINGRGSRFKGMKITSVILLEGGYSNAEVVLL